VGESQGSQSNKLRKKRVPQLGQQKERGGGKVIRSSDNHSSCLTFVLKQCQGHTEILLINSKACLYTILQQHNEYDHIFHILRCINFSGNLHQPSMNDNNYKRLWKMRTLFEQLNDMYTKFYNTFSYG